MEFSPCGCGKHNYTRIHRSWWARIFIGRRQYRCAKCGRTLLLPSLPTFAPEAVREAGARHASRR